MGLRLGDIAPNFSAKTTKGEIVFHDWKKDSWAILFSHPEDFTPVCTTELGAVARLQEEWDKRGIKTIGLSCNTVESHQSWIADINETQNTNVQFPIIEDFDRKIATLYDMLDYQDATNVDKKGLPLTVRSVFILDPKNVIRLTFTYPASCGRNFDEVLRVIDALQLSEKKKVVTPVNWKGTQDEVIIHTAVSNDEAEKLFPGYRTVKPYLRFTKV
ncbi:thioredoxin-like protein [Zopfochytrium polystomum]|nr:thioredoxin-like protein [Zopfochytrium polystomum]